MNAASAREGGLAIHAGTGSEHAFRWHPSSTLHDEHVRLVRPEARHSGDPLPAAGAGEQGVVPVRIAAGSQASGFAAILRAAGAGQEFLALNAGRDDEPAVSSDPPAAPGSRCDDSAPDGRMAEPRPGGERYFRCRSSGTSGRGRTVRRSHRSWILSFRSNQHRWSLGPGDNYGVPGDLGHSLALYGAMEAAHLGADLHLLGGLRPDRQVEALAARNMTILYATPTQIRLMAEAPRRRHKPAPSVRLVLAAGSKLDAVARRQAVELFPNAEICEFYGSSEASFVAISDHETPANSVGRAYPGVELRIGGGQACETGEILVSSPYLFDGYCGDIPGPARWHGRLLSVGESGYLDKDGYLHLAGRVDRMFNVADQLVHPEAIENVLLEIDGVERAAVVPWEDPLRGCVPVAFIKPGESWPGIEGIERQCRAAIGPHASPRRIFIRDAWPLLPSGKTDLAALARMLTDPEH